MTGETRSAFGTTRVEAESVDGDKLRVRCTFTPGPEYADMVNGLVEAAKRGEVVVFKGADTIKGVIKP